MRALVLDGDQRSTLAVTRSLGRRGVEVTVGEKSNHSLAAVSRYCSSSIVYPSPYADSVNFLSRLADYGRNADRPLLLPMTDVTVGEVLKGRERLDGLFHLPFVDYETYAAVTDKVTLFRMASQLNVPIPATLFSPDFSRRDDLIREAEKLAFPLVIKPFQSRIQGAQGWFNARVSYAVSPQELRGLLERPEYRDFPFMLQERVIGPGLGIFFLMKDGEVKAQFAHRRVREKPPSGGVSVVCESIEPPPATLSAAERLLKHFDWYGAAMVEFKMDSKDNTPKLMEVNARFWGSLQLSIFSGIDFPYLLYRLANGEDPQPATRYRTGVRLRRELGDFDHLLLRLFKNGLDLNLPPQALSKWMVAKRFVQDFFAPEVRNEVLNFHDPGPFFLEFKRWIADLV